MRKRSLLSDRLSFITTLAMVFVYTFLGIILISGKTNLFTGVTGRIFGGVLLFYAVYRLYYVFRRKRNVGDEN